MYLLTLMNLINNKSMILMRSNTEKYAAQGKFAEGSMLPKIEAAAILFVESGENKKVIITNLEQAYEALIGNKGTHIHM